MSLFNINPRGTKKAKKIPEADRLGITAEEIVELLRRRHKDRQWVFYPELYYSTKAKEDKKNADSRVDAWAFNVWASRNFCRVTYEIKISRHDFLREMRAGLSKRQPGLHISNQFYYVIPDGCVTVDEIPEECGLLVVRKPAGKDYYALLNAKKAPWREIEPSLPVDFWASLARRVNIEEGEYIRQDPHGRGKNS